MKTSRMLIGCVITEITILQFKKLVRFTIHFLLCGISGTTMTMEDLLQSYG